jgi:pimeloyl-ACP methyl ester carboxylesterase
MERPETRYVDVGGAEVAYQIVGQGPPDVVYVPGFSHVDVTWEEPVYATFLDRLASFGRLILFDRRGTGASDAVPDTAMPTWEEWADDVGAVLDAAWSERAVVLAETDGGPAGLLFTATHPERVTGLILANTTARRLRANNYPIGIAPEAVDGVIETHRATWGTPDRVPMTFPSRVNDPEFGRWLAKAGRAAATPRSAAAQIRYMIESLDAREALPLILPTLVLHTENNLVYSIEEGRYLADHSAGAKFVELPGADFYVAFSAPAIEEIAKAKSAVRD